ncbi:hypothetical protein [Verrucomicrobium spinosum]|uniref:hypothetical protein n=1 Tax=Verrucomicrobium spinosum TaxID=2736 RepID=UPI0001745B6E|nr:hypothetical protein [Verrucomicrobium spinosum]
MQHHPSINCLSETLAKVSPGKVESSEVISLLGDAWFHFGGSDEGAMRGDKVLPDRLENLEWHPPILSFIIERHARLMNGSTRADLQYWEVNTEIVAAKIVKMGNRQKHAQAKRWDHKPLALELANKIRNGQDDDRLRWKKNGTVTINRECVPDGAKQTLDSRCKRLNNAIGELLNDPEWREKSWRHSETADPRMEDHRES